MQHGIGTTQQAIQRCVVEEIALHQLALPPAGARAAGSRTKARNRWPLGQEFADGMSPGKARGAGDGDCLVHGGLVKSRANPRPELRRLHVHRLHDLGDFAGKILLLGCRPATACPTR